MRSVTRYPPTTFIVASVTAMTPSIAPISPSSDPATISAPTITIPDIALEPDISGVCRVGGTRVIVRYPTNSASTNTVRDMSSVSIMVVTF